jgi:hypothetical protein
LIFLLVFLVPTLAAAQAAVLAQARAVRVRALLILILVLITRLLPTAAGAAVLIARAVLLPRAGAARLADVAVATGLRTVRLGLRCGASDFLSRLAVVVEQEIVVAVSPPKAGAHPLLPCVGAAAAAPRCGRVRAR